MQRCVLDVVEGDLLGMIHLMPRLLYRVTSRVGTRLALPLSVS